MKRHYHVIGACTCWAAQIRACEKGPEDLVEGRVFERLKEEGIVIDEVEMIYPSKRAEDTEIPPDQVLPIVTGFNKQLMTSLKRALKNGLFPIVVGGDHSIAVGTWNAFEVPFGLLWIDAHMDAHTPETSPSGAYHGMPLAALLGRGGPEMAKFSRNNPVLKPENVALIGIRSFEESEKALLTELNVKIYYMDEVHERGLQEIIPEAIQHITKGVSHYGVSLDLDVFTVDEAPGVGSREEGGMQKKDLLPFLSLFGKDEKLIGFELVELNPDRDIDHKTRELSFEILKEMMGS